MSQENKWFKALNKEDATRQTLHAIYAKQLPEESWLISIATEKAST